MIYLAKSMGIVLVIEMLMTLTNLTAANSPMMFPKPYEYYPCENKNMTVNCNNIIGDNSSPEFIFPLYLQTNYFQNKNLNWAIFFGIDIQFS